MPLAKGKTNNPKGRPKGTPDKVTTELRQWVQQLIDDNRERLARDFDTLDPAERWRIVEKLMQYTVPKMQAVEAKIGLNRMTDEQLDTMINELHAKIYED